MTTAPPPSPPSVGRLTGFVLGFTVFACIVMIGLAAYLKYQLDRSEAILAAPESALIGEQKQIEKLRRTLGFGGFVGSAQSFVASRDANILSDMRGETKAAAEVIERLPEGMPPETAHDLQAILATFNAALLKAEKSASEPNAFTSADLAPLYAALPVLDSRITAAAGSQRLAAEDSVQFWAMLLTLISWVSLIIAAAASAGIYLSLLSRRSAPMRALAQSVRNMAQGDMRTSIWGMERQDMIGELARSIDMARYQFSQMPDMSLLSDKGPVRIRFEGNTRSLFEAMMGMISKDAEQVRGTAKGLHEAVARQQEVITLLSSRVEAVLHNVEKRGLDGDRQVKDIVQSMIGSAQSLRHAQEHASDQLNRIVPFLQERAQGLAEIAQITGKQVAQALNSLATSERGLKSSAELSDEAIKKLSATADDLGQRMFGAVNLLQASGKVLAETTETTQSRLNEAIDRLGKGGVIMANPAPAVPDDRATEAVAALALRIEAAIATLENAQKKLEERIAQQSATIPAAPPDPAADVAPKVTAVIDALEAARKKLEERVAEQTHAAEAQISLLATQSGGLLTQTATMTQTLSAASDHLREAQAKFDETMTGIAARLSDIGSRFEKKTEDFASSTAEQLQHEQSRLGEIIASMTGKMDELGNALKRKADEAFGKTGTAAEQSLQHLATLTIQIDRMTEKMAALGKATDAMEAVIAGAPREPAFVGVLQADIRSGLDRAAADIGELKGQLEAMTASVAKHAEAPAKELLSGMRDQWYQTAAQIEATRASLEKAIAQQVSRIEARLGGIRAEPVTPEETEDARQQMEQQTQILAELVATMSLLDAHMQDIRSQMTEIREKRAG